MKFYFLFFFLSLFSFFVFFLCAHFCHPVTIWLKHTTSTSIKGFIPSHKILFKERFSECRSWTNKQAQIMAAMGSIYQWIIWPNNDERKCLNHLSMHEIKFDRAQASKHQMRWWNLNTQKEVANVNLGSKLTG